MAGNMAFKLSRSTVALLVLFCLHACTGMRSDFETPTVTVNSFRTIPSDTAMPKFEIGLHVTNPNREDLKLDGVAYRVSVEGRNLINGVGNDLPVIEGYGEGEFVVTAAVSIFQGAMLLKDLMNSPKEKLKYSFEAKLDIGAFAPPIRVKDEGEFSLQPSQPRDSHSL